MCWRRHPRRKAQVIVTFNEADFRPTRWPASTSWRSIRTRSCAVLVDLNPAIVRARVAQMLQRWRQPPNTPEAFIGAIGAHRFACRRGAEELFAAG